MPIDIRTEAAKYYDRNPGTPEDIPFYQALIPSPAAAVLELGCGTGRVTLPLAQSCAYIHGLDISAAMLELCQQKIQAAHLTPTRIKIEQRDITGFDLGRTFDLIIAPFRVMQNLETDEEVDGLFHCIRRHLAPGGSAVLNVFKPLYSPEIMVQRWVSNVEQFNWEVQIEGERITCHDRRPRLDPEKLVLYPELIYRRYDGEALVEEAVLKLAMRCYYPDQLDELIRSYGFTILKCWGGYGGEAYGQGPELVVQFKD